MIDKFNFIIERIGADKLLHFFLSAWLVAESKEYGFIAMIATFLVVLIVGVIKEQVLDKEPDKKDWLWSVYGGLISILLWFL